MPILKIYVTDDTHERLAWYARERSSDSSCTVETLAEAAVEEAALRADDRWREQQPLYAGVDLKAISSAFPRHLK